MKLSSQISVPTFSWSNSHVTVELKTNISEISSISIIRADIDINFETEEISETLVSNSALTWLITQENFNVSYRVYWAVEPLLLSKVHSKAVTCACCTMLSPLCKVECFQWIFVLKLRKLWKCYWELKGPYLSIWSSCMGRPENRKQENFFWFPCRLKWA